MDGWATFGTVIDKLPPILATMLITGIVVIFAIGFTRRGLNFVKYGFGKMGMDQTMEARFDRLDERLDKVDMRLDRVDERLDKIDKRFDRVEADIGNLHTELQTVKTNHFGHLKGFLTELTSILLDKEVINNTDKARLDNQLRNM